MLSRATLTAARTTQRGFSTAGWGRLDGKTIVVAGAGNPPEEGHGIGATTSLVLARLGANVVSVSNEQLNCDTVTDAIVAEGNTGAAFTADCTQGKDVEAVLDFAKQTYGNVDVVINAGIHSALPMGFGKMSEEAWEKGIALNLTAHFQLIHKFLPHFLEQESGNFVHMTTIASTVGLGVGPQRHAYAAGKAAAATLTKRIGVENAKKNIRGNVIGIGYVTGPLVNRAVAQAISGGSSTTIEKVTAVRDAYVPRGTQVVPEEVANLAAFLSSDLSSGVNGTEIYCDAGTSGCTYGP
eukprot:TRINITY_DN1572_c0_g2_i8.p1 TRINITY_DN1572_c0_g2~~TRINITY_DN1572_c0_g2_i8.p1  ORF type:complete len:296 (-),score=83.38 TRINITY_DN1572_c0_g2_i8:228-1115(-)